MARRDHRRTAFDFPEVVVTPEGVSLQVTDSGLLVPPRGVEDFEFPNSVVGPSGVTFRVNDRQLVPPRTGPPQEDGEEGEEGDDPPTFDDLIPESRFEERRGDIAIPGDDIQIETDGLPIPFPWQGLQRAAIVFNLNYVYNPEDDEWVRDTGNGSGGGVWTEDSNSPHSLSGSSSYTVNIADPRDQFWISITNFDVSGSVPGEPDFLGLQVNGDTAANYAGQELDGTGESGSEVPVSFFDGSDIPFSVGIFCDGRWNGDWTADVHGRGDFSGLWDTALNGSVSSPLSQVSITQGTVTFSATAEVYGRDVG